MPERVLKRYEVFRDGSEQLQEELAGIAKRYRDNGAKHVYTAGDSVDKVLFIGEGALNVFVSGYSGRNVTLYNVAPGEMCPINLGAALSTGTMLASAKGKNEFHAAAVSVSDFKRLIREHTELRSFVMASLASKFESIVRQISEITTQSVDSRIQRFFGDHLEDCDELGVLRVTNEQIGTEIGASREVINRKLRQLQEAGLVELGRGSVRILDADRLISPKSAAESEDG